MIVNKKAIGAVAAVLTVLLAALGIDRLGGETWVTAAAKAEAGWYAEVRPYPAPPVPFLRDFFAPVLLIAMAVVLAAAGALLNRFSRRDLEQPPAADGEKSV